MFNLSRSNISICNALLLFIRSSNLSSHAFPYPPLPAASFFRLSKFRQISNNTEPTHTFAAMATEHESLPVTLPTLFKF
jgi:hypothetical protein